MTNRSTDILFIAEYIKGVLHFATVREGKTLKSSRDVHYFCIDNELVYENYYSDFGPLNLGCVYKYCKLLNDKLKQHLNKQTIVHYTSIDPKKKTNSAFLLGCYGVLYLSLQPKDALKPLMVHGQSYRPFQDATQGDSIYTISIMDCLQAIKKAKELGFFNFQDFNYEEYERLDKIQGGDLNWIVPGKFLAFIGPVDYSVSLYHPPEMYIDYFVANNVKIVIRLNKRLYDGKVFENSGINHYDLFFPDGSCPPRHILLKFLQISEESDGAIAVHCKAGLGRTGSLIGCYLIKHYRMTSREAIGWMRICRPGSVIGHQQAWLEQVEAWLIKQGNLYRKRAYNDPDKIPYHNLGVYSIAEFSLRSKSLQQRPVAIHKSPSPPPAPPPCGRTMLSDIGSPVRSQVSKPSDSKNADKMDNEDDEIFLTSCDLTVKPATSMTQLKGCIIKTSTISEEYDEDTSYSQENIIPLWKRIICCKSCTETFIDGLWAISVRCARVAPNKTNKLCTFIDMVAAHKTQKEPFEQCLVRPSRMSSQRVTKRRDPHDSSSNSPCRRGTGAGEPRIAMAPSKASAKGLQVQKPSTKSIDPNVRKPSTYNNYSPHMTTFRTTNGPVIKNVSDARKFLLRSSMYSEERERNLMSTVTVTAHTHAQERVPNYTTIGHASPPPHMTPSAFSTTASRGSTQPQQRRRLGRSPSPQPMRMLTEQTRATNTPPAPKTKFLAKTDSKSNLREALSRLKLLTPRDGSIGAASVGAASLGARRDAPVPKRAPSVRSDERPLATQGDLLNSIKFQRRLRDTLHSDKFPDRHSNPTPKDKPCLKNDTSRNTTGPRQSVVNQNYNSRERPCLPSKNILGPTRPTSPKGRRTPHSPTFH